MERRPGISRWNRDSELRGETGPWGIWMLRASAPGIHLRPLSWPLSHARIHRPDRSTTDCGCASLQHRERGPLKLSRKSKSYGKSNRCGCGKLLITTRVRTWALGYLAVEPGEFQSEMYFVVPGMCQSWIRVTRGSLRVLQHSLLYGTQPT